MSRFVAEEDLATVQEKTIKDGISSIIAVSNKIEIIKQKPIKKATPLLKRGDQPILYPRTLTPIQGQTGTFKSSLAQIISSAFISEEISPENTLGFERITQEPVNLIYADTERNDVEQFPMAIQKILLMAGYKIEDEPDHLDYISLLRINRNKRFLYLSKYLELSRRKKKGPMVVVLDVITDFVNDFNDNKESGPMIDLMNVYENNFNTTFLPIIHENPNSEKARGHLGTELANKASSVLQVSFENGSREIVRISSKKNRNAKDFYSFYAQYNEEVQGLKEIDHNPSFSYKPSVKAPLKDVYEWIVDNVEESIERKELIDSLKEEFNCSGRTIIDRLTELLNNKDDIPETWPQGYTLEKEPAGNKIVFKLLKPQLDE